MSDAPGLDLHEVPGRYAVIRLAAEAPVPGWATTGPFTSITRTHDELSIVCLAGQVPLDARAERGWRMLRVSGPLDFALTGVMASLAGPLAAAGVSLFAIATFDTDYLLVRATQWDVALTALGAAGHRVAAS